MAWLPVDNGAAAPLVALPAPNGASVAGTALSEVKADPLMAEPLVAVVLSGTAEPLVSPPGIDMLLLFAILSADEGMRSDAMMGKGSEKRKVATFLS